jgi:hypothetical protein
MKTIINALSTLAMALCFALVLSYAWDDQFTQSTLDGIAATKADMRTDAGKRQACGPNAAWHDIDATTIQFVSKKGRKTIKVSL